ncbi:cation:proton antiporter [Conexibacter sp. CPCC 206217]|uniref:cation:proton antiporter n=1 Tax=Conexibacter sp. CPCC 206217 TaxID=3064574 RepID=UPI00271920B2|nr:cation:proton antiporter [Conexibacter sp. CPCC 206217]MDO8212825.1 cation:proton antiporter [Conexibacter sp. CPCC 206217]
MTPGDVDSGSFLAIVVVAAMSAVLAGLIARRLVVPVVVLELVLGIVIGPEVLGIAQNDPFISFFSNLGLGMLFFFAGYEIDFDRIKGQPLKLAALGWLISLVLAYALGGILAALGIVLSLVFVGSAMATTAIGTLIPILRDANELRTRFGTYLLGAGAMGEFGPILLITLVFSTKSALSNAAILIAFIVLTVLTGVITVRSVGTGWDLVERTLEASSQLAIRVTVVVVFALAALAAELGLDLLLGGFVAGVILRLALRGREVEVLESKLTAIGYGFLIPFFFVVSGINVNLSALTDDPIEFLKVPMFLALFLIVRGAPAMLLYRKVLSARDRTALAFFSATELPLVVAITTIAVEEGHMRSSTAASLIVAAICSTAIYPIVGLKLRGQREGDEQESLGGSLGDPPDVVPVHSA